MSSYPLHPTSCRPCGQLTASENIVMTHLVTVVEQTFPVEHPYPAHSGSIPRYTVIAITYLDTITYYIPVEIG